MSEEAEKKDEEESPEAEVAQTETTEAVDDVAIPPDNEEAEAVETKEETPAEAKEEAPAVAEETAAEPEAETAEAPPEEAEPPAESEPAAEEPAEAKEEVAAAEETKEEEAPEAATPEEPATPPEESTPEPVAEEPPVDDDMIIPEDDVVIPEDEPVEKKEETEEGGDDLDELEAEIQAQLAKQPAPEEVEEAAVEESKAEEKETEETDEKDKKDTQEETSSSGGLNPRIPIAIGALGVILGGMSLQMTVQIKKGMEHAAAPPPHLFENLSKLKDSEKLLMEKVGVLEEKFNTINEHIKTNTAPINDSLKMLHHDLSEVKQGIEWNSETIRVINLTIAKLFNEDIEGNRIDFENELEAIRNKRMEHKPLPIDTVAKTIERIDAPIEDKQTTKTPDDSHSPSKGTPVVTVADAPKQTLPPEPPPPPVAKALKPTAPQPVAPPAPVIAKPTVHIIAEGDNFRLIAKKYGVPITAIMGENPNVDPRDLSVGQEIKLPRL